MITPLQNFTNLNYKSENKVEKCFSYFNFNLFSYSNCRILNDRSNKYYGDLL